MNAPLTLNTAESIENAQRKPGIEGLFDELLGIYGKQFADKWEGVDPVTVKRSWIKGLKGFTPDEIHTGLEACYDSKFAPNLADFRERCRPASTLNVDALLYVAIDCMSARRSRMPENWPDARTFWAAVNIGNDLLLLPAEKLKSRWAASYQRAEDRANDPIPPAVKPESTLPAPGKTTISREEAAKRTETLNAAAKVGRPAATMYTRWAHDIAEKPEGLPMVTLEKAVKAFVAWGQQIPERLVAHVCERGLQKLLPEGV